MQRDKTKTTFHMTGSIRGWGETRVGSPDLPLPLGSGSAGRQCIPKKLNQPPCSLGKQERDEQVWSPRVRKTASEDDFPLTLAGSGKDLKEEWYQQWGQQVQSLGAQSSDLGQTTDRLFSLDEPLGAGWQPQ
jgi:hypothetical protein